MTKTTARNQRENKLTEACKFMLKLSKIELEDYLKAGYEKGSVEVDATTINIKLLEESLAA